MTCDKTAREVEPEEVRPGVLRCPACGDLLDEDTLVQLPESTLRI